jgi:high-affinity iron transporter
MFATALIVFRESLEAALFVGIVAAATRQLAGRARLLSVGVCLGVAGALLLALSARQLSEWADGLGQDLVNIAVLSVALVLLLWHCLWVSPHAREMARDARHLGESVRGGLRAPWVLAGAVALAVLREGAETVLFVAGSLTGSTASAANVALSALGGLAVGVGLGALLYAGLTRIPARQLFATTNVLIALVAASIASQLVKALSQAGFLASGGAALWDSSLAIAPDSAAGTVLHALVGYEAQPTAAQLIAYLTVLALIFAGTRWMQKPRPSRRPAP